jgi:hypothetical protein
VQVDQWRLPDLSAADSRSDHPRQARLVPLAGEGFRLKTGSMAARSRRHRPKVMPAKRYSATSKWAKLAT